MMCPNWAACSLWILALQLSRSWLQALSRRMTAANVMTMAAGGVAPAFRMYVHAQSAGPSAPRFLAEVLLNSTTSMAAVTVKTSDAASAQAFGNLVKGLLEG